jgi:hypothetical protein
MRIVLPVAFYAIIHFVLARRYYGYEFFNFLGDTYSLKVSFGVMMAYITLLSAGALLCLYNLLSMNIGKVFKYAICFTGGAFALVLMHVYVIHNAYVWFIPIDPAEHIAAAMRNCAIAAVLSSLVVWLFLEKLVPWTRGQYWGVVIDSEANEPIPWNHGGI